MLVPTKLSFYCWHLIKRGENRAEWRVAFSEGGKQKKAERRGQEGALDFESRDRHKNQRRRFTFSGLILEKKKKDKWKQEQIFMVCSSGAKQLQLRFSSQLLTASKKQHEKKEEVEEIVVSGLV